MSSFLTLKSVCWTSIFRNMSRDVWKRTFKNVRPAKIQISLRIRAVWSESSPCAFWTAKDVDNGYLDPTARMRRLIWVFVGGSHVRTYVLLRYGSYILFCTIFLLIVLKEHVWNDYVYLTSMLTTFNYTVDSRYLDIAYLGITAYLEVKIWSLPKPENLTTCKKYCGKRRNCS